MCHRVRGIPAIESRPYVVDGEFKLMCHRVRVCQVVAAIEIRPYVVDGGFKLTCRRARGRRRA